MMVRFLLLAAHAGLSMTLTACGSTDRPPTAPSPPSAIEVDHTRTPLELSSDPYLLQLNGFDATYDGTSRPCTPLGVPSNGKSVTTFLWFIRDGDEWVGRPRPPYASTLAMRVRRTGSSILGVAFEGTIDGSAADEFDPVMGKIDLVFNVEQDGEVEGVATPAAAGGRFPSRLAGTLRGHFSFANAAREVATCTSAQFYLEPRVSGLPAGWMELEPSGLEPPFQDDLRPRR